MPHTSTDRPEVWHFQGGGSLPREEAAWSAPTSAVLLCSTRSLHSGTVLPQAWLPVGLFPNLLGTKTQLCPQNFMTTEVKHRAGVAVAAEATGSGSLCFLVSFYFPGSWILHSFSDLNRSSTFSQKWPLPYSSPKQTKDFSWLPLLHTTVCSYD